MLDAGRLADSSVLVLHEPFPLLVAHDQLPASAQPALEQLTSEAEKSRKARRGRSSRPVKKLIGRLDRWFGANRERNVSHRD